MLAGPLTEKRQGSLNYQSESDIKQVDRLLRDSELRLDQLIDETETLLTRYWAEIELLAHSAARFPGEIVTQLLSD
jgi:hypothetical protein